MAATKKLCWLLAVLVVVALAWKGVDLLTRPPDGAAPPSARPAARQDPAALAATLSSAGVRAPLQTAPAIEEMVRAAAGDPEKSFEAFKQIEECLTLEKDKEIVDQVDVKLAKQEDGVQLQILQHKADDKALQALRRTCAGLTGRTRLDRFQMLTYAVDHHVAGALAVYIFAGPQGDRQALKERPDDPEVAAWRGDALKRLDERIAQGYVDAVMVSTNAYLALGKDQAEADLYMEQLATNKILSAINSDAGIYPKEILDGWTRKISAQQRAEAEAQAERIFQAWKQRAAAQHATILPSPTRLAR